MSVGKAISQAGHAYVNTVLKTPPTLLRDYQGDGLGTKVCLQTDNLQKLFDAYNFANDAGIPTSLIVDSGHVHLPDFDGSPVVTAVGIGPCTKEQSSLFLNHFKLYKGN